MSRLHLDKWLSILLVGFIVTLIYLQYLVSQSTEMLKSQEIEKTKAYAEHIVNLLLQETQKDMYQTLKHDKTKRDTLNKLLEVLLIPKYRYIFVVQKKDNQQYRFLLDGSKKDKEAFGALFVPVDSIYDRVYDSRKATIVRQQDDVKGVWISLLYPIVRNGRTEAMLIIDMSDWYGSYLNDFNTPIGKTLRYVQLVLLMLLFVLLLLSWRYRRLRQSLYSDEISGAGTKNYMHHLFQKVAIDHYNVILIDIDEFREINKLYGYMTGNVILKEFVSWLRKSIPGGCEIVRTGGAEFFVFVPKKYDIKTLMDTLHERLQTIMFQVGNEEIGLKASMAALTVPGQTRSLQYVQHVLYEGLLHVKSRGKNKTILLDMKTVDELKYRQIDYIQHLIDQERIVLHYQPICETQSEKIVKYEALVRLVDEQSNIIPPNQFLDIIRGTSVYIKMSKLIFQEVLHKLYQSPTLHISINLDLDDLHNEEMMQVLCTFLEANVQVANRITFEILETRNIEDYDDVNAIFDKLRVYGSLVAIDDFGTGYANFQHIAYLHVDIIKVDGSLICKLDQDNERIEVILSSIVSLARCFGFKTVAEYVSSETILHKVKQLGFDYAQGYYLGKPKPLELRKD